MVFLRKRFFSEPGRESPPQGQPDDGHRDVVEQLRRKLLQQRQLPLPVVRSDRLCRFEPICFLINIVSKECFTSVSQAMLSNLAI